MRFILAIVVTLSFASVASADDFWYTEALEQGTNNATPNEIATRLSSLRPGQTAYYQEFGAGVLDSKLLDVSQCKAFTALFYRSAGSAATAHLMDNRTAGAVLGAALGTKILNDSGDLDLDGIAATGLAYIYNVVGVNWIYVDITVAPAGTDYGTMRITCIPSE